MMARPIPPKETPMPADSAPKYKKVLLKVSGEVLMGDQGYGIDMDTVDTVAAAIARVEDRLAREQLVHKAALKKAAEEVRTYDTYLRYVLTIRTYDT